MSEHEAAEAPRMTWGRAFARGAVGVILAAGLGWLIVVVGATIGATAVVAFTEESGQPLNFTIMVGAFAAVVGVPLALIIGVPVWLLTDRRYLNTWRSGAVAGTLTALMVAIPIPPLAYVLPFAGALAGGLAVHLTNRLVPKVPPA
ncbi:MAG: hypothetical protein AAGF49_05600 [Pseudomonadota bacterium]